MHYKGTGGKLQQEKIFYYYWRWEIEKWKRVIKNVSTEVQVHNNKTTQNQFTQDTLTLGIYLMLNLDWSPCLRKIRKKPNKMTKKMMRIEMKSW